VFSFVQQSKKKGPVTREEEMKKRDDLESLVLAGDTFGGDWRDQCRL